MSDEFDLVFLQTLTGGTETLRSGIPASEALGALEQAEQQRDTAQAALRALEERITTEHDEIKALLIEMRRYFISHNCPTGECVAWNGLKGRFGVGRRDEEDEAWMTARTGEPFVLRRSADERRRRNRE